MNAERLAKFPPWKQAIDDAVVEFTYGDVIPFAWLHDRFELYPPESGTAEQFREYHFGFLQAMDSFRRELLEEHQMDLSNVRGEGYRVLKPSEQTQHAMKKMRDTVARELRRTASRLENVNHELLSNDEQKENREARGKLAALTTFTRKQLK